MNRNVSLLLKVKLTKRKKEEMRLKNPLWDFFKGSIFLEKSSLLVLKVRSDHNPNPTADWNCFKNVSK